MAEARGDTQGAITLLLNAATLAESVGLPGEAWQIDAALAMLYSETGAADRAALRNARAEQQLRMLADALADPALRDRFLRAATAGTILWREPSRRTVP